MRKLRGSFDLCLLACCFSKIISMVLCSADIAMKIICLPVVLCAVASRRLQISRFCELQMLPVLLWCASAY